jgi:WD40 repeat protein
VSGDGDGHVLLWDLATGRASPLDQHDGRAYQVEYSPRGTLIVSTSVDHRALIRDRRNQTVLGQRGYDTSFGPIAITPDDEIVVLGAKTGDVVLRRLANGATAHVRAHDGMILSLTFLDDSRLLATTGLDGHLQLWPVADLLEAAVPRDPHPLRAWLRSATDLQLMEAGRPHPTNLRNTRGESK